MCRVEGGCWAGLARGEAWSLAWVLAAEQVNPINNLPRLIAREIPIICVNGPSRRHSYLVMVEAVEIDEGVTI